MGWQQMNSRQREIQQQFLNNEKDVLKEIEANYKDALAEINERIEKLLERQDVDMQHVIYQVEYQEALKKQVEAILETLHTNEFETVSGYLTKSYEDGFVGTMYDLQGQGIPLIFPIDQRQVVEAIQLETKLSERLYTAMGKDIKELQKKISVEISRGLSNGMMYAEIARNVAGYAKIPKNRAMTIARTEAHRIQCKASMDVCCKAKDKGADVLKQWDAALDGRTRDTHRELDGQIRELDEPFEIAGKKAMQPGGFGDPAEDCNCRCALLQRARWALGDAYTKWSPDAPVQIADDGTTQLVKIEEKSYNSFKKSYYAALETTVIEDTITSNGIRITGISKHCEERINERGLSIADIKDAFVNPLHICDISVDDQKRKSQRFIGETVTVNVNPDTGYVPTAWKTGKATVRKYRKDAGNEI